MATAIPGAGSTNTRTQATFTPQPAPKDGQDAFRDLDIKNFLDLMIAELQNQDPLNPMDNSQILEQLGQLRSIASSDKLSKTLDTVLQGQSFASASGLIGKKISGLADNGTEVDGTVDKATISDGEIRLHVGDAAVRLANVREILPQ
jgi:flagellar basal-body rod modification protein FlgD